MKKCLEKIKKELFYYNEKNNKIIGAHKNITGDVSGIRGDVDKANITEKEREKGINIEDLILRGDK